MTILEKGATKLLWKVTFTFRINYSKMVGL